MGDNKIIHTKVISGENKTKALVLGVVLDATLSFSVVYGQIYYLIEHLLINLKKLKKDKCDIDISYSVVLLHDKPENMRFSGKRSISKDEDEVLRSLADISFYGGSDDGHEELNSALNLQLKTINQYMDSVCKQDKNVSVSQQLIILTDSAAAVGKEFQNFTQNEPGVYGDYTNHGLQQAFIISNGGDYMPQLRIVNLEYSLTENNVNTCSYYDIQDILDKDEEGTLIMAEVLAKKIIQSA